MSGGAPSASGLVASCCARRRRAYSRRAPGGDRCRSRSPARSGSGTSWTPGATFGRFRSAAGLAGRRAAQALAARGRAVRVRRAGTARLRLSRSAVGVAEPLGLHDRPSHALAEPGPSLFACPRARPAVLYRQSTCPRGRASASSAGAADSRRRRRGSERVATATSRVLGEVDQRLDDEERADGDGEQPSDGAPGASRSARRRAAGRRRAAAPRGAHVDRPDDARGSSRG